MQSNRTFQKQNCSILKFYKFPPALPLILCHNRVIFPLLREEEVKKTSSRSEKANHKSNESYFWVFPKKSYFELKWFRTLWVGQWLVNDAECWSSRVNILQNLFKGNVTCITAGSTRAYYGIAEHKKNLHLKLHQNEYKTNNTMKYWVRKWSKAMCGVDIQWIWYKINIAQRIPLILWKRFCQFHLLVL